MEQEGERGGRQQETEGKQAIKSLYNLHKEMVGKLVRDGGERPALAHKHYAAVVLSLLCFVITACT